jgi:hypothetical protein
MVEAVEHLFQQAQSPDLVPQEERKEERKKL